MNKIRNAHEFKAAQAGAFSASDHPFPTYADLLRVLNGWKGKICLEFIAGEMALSVGVLKYDLVTQIRQQTLPFEKCELHLSFIDIPGKVLVFARPLGDQDANDAGTI